MGSIVHWGSLFRSRAVSEATSCKSETRTALGLKRTTPQCKLNSADISHKGKTTLSPAAQASRKNLFAAVSEPRPAPSAGCGWHARSAYSHQPGISCRTTNGQLARRVKQECLQATCVSNLGTRVSPLTSNELEAHITWIQNKKLPCVGAAIDFNCQLIWKARNMGLCLQRTSVRPPVWQVWWVPVSHASCLLGMNRGKEATVFWAWVARSLQWGKSAGEWRTTPCQTLRAALILSSNVGKLSNCFTSSADSPQTCSTPENRHVSGGRNVVAAAAMRGSTS